MIKVFVDASVLFAAAYSPKGYARDLIRLALEERVLLLVSEHVLDEVRRNLAEDYPEKLSAYEVIVDNLPFEVVPKPTKEELLAVAAYTALKDAPIVAAAIKGEAEYLGTFDRKHLIGRPEVAQKSGLKIVLPEEIVKVIRRGKPGNDLTN